MGLVVKGGETVRGVLASQESTPQSLVLGGGPRARIQSTTGPFRRATTAPGAEKRFDGGRRTPQGNCCWLGNRCAEDGDSRKSEDDDVTVTISRARVTLWHSAGRECGNEDREWNRDRGLRPGHTIECSVRLFWARECQLGSDIRFRPPQVCLAWRPPKANSDHPQSVRALQDVAQWPSRGLSED